MDSAHIARRDTSYVWYLFVWISVIIAFAAAYWLLSYIPGHGSDQIAAAGDPLDRFLTALYFSVITGATVGYGDVLPVGFSRALAAFEGILSFVLLAVFVSRLATRGQAAAIADIHSLARDSLFNNFRHGLFIARKDLDSILVHLKARAALEERDWKNIRTAFRQMHSEISSIPQLYATSQSSSFIDGDHEQLVLDSVERSLRRASQMLDALEAHGTSYKTDEKCKLELENLVNISHHSFVTLFETAQNPENDEAFREMLSRLDELKKHV